MNYVLNKRSFERAKALIDDGHISDSASWSFGPADGNEILGDGGRGNNWLAFAMVHLAIDRTAKADTKAAYAFPYAKSDGIVNLAGLRQIRAQSRQSDPGIYAAAGELLDAAKLRMQQKTTAGGSHEITLTASATITAAGDGTDGKPRIRRFEMNAYNGGEMKLKGWNHAVVIDLAGVSGANRPRPIFLNHDETKIVGHADRVAVDSSGINAAGAISGAGPAAAEVLASHDSGFPWQASVGARPDQVEFVDRGKTAQANGKTWHGPINIARKTTLGEISFVPLGADDSTSVRIAATRNNSQKRTKHMDSELDTIDQNDPAAVERKRMSAIHRIAAKYANVEASARHEIMEKACNECWTEDKAELALIRADRVPVPMAGVRTVRGDSLDERKIIEASMLMECRLPETFVGKFYDQRSMDAAQSAGARGMTLHSLLRAVIRATGQTAPDRIDSSAITTAFKCDQMLSAAGGGGYSTMSLSGILSNVQNKLMLQSYQSVPTTWESWVAISEVKDFKPALRLRLVGAGEFAKVAPAGEIQNMSLQDQQYTNQASTSGALIVITREALINDDQSALMQQPQILGRSAAVAVEKSVYTLLLANTNNLFGSGNKNVQSGAGSVLQTSSLSSAERLMIEQLDDNKQPVMLRPSALLVPPALKTTAENLFNGANLIVTALASTSSKAVEPNKNAFFSRYTPQVSPWLGSAVGLPGASDTLWFLMNDPASGVSPLEIMFVNGQRAPIIETGEANFNTLGLATRAYLDFGVGQQDPRAGVMSAGA